MLGQMQEQSLTKSGPASLDPGTMFKTLFPQSVGLGEMQKAFWSQFGASQTER